MIKNKSKLPDNRVTQHMSIIKSKNDWETPKEIYIEAFKKYNIHPTLDVAASSENKLCSHYFGLDHKVLSKRNALQCKINETFYMNPPYDPDYSCTKCHSLNSFVKKKLRKKTKSGKPKYKFFCTKCKADIKSRKTLHKGVSDFIKWAYSEHKRTNHEGIVLTFAKTDTKWWHKYVEGKAEIHFINGRLRFNYHKMKSAYPAPYGSCFIIYRSKK